MPRFALLRHECPAEYRDGPHWDLMLERPDTAAERRLATWSLLELPSHWAEALGRPATSARGAIDATRLDDHRAVYLEYEGSVSGDRGRVERCARGAISWRVWDEQTAIARLEEPSPLGAEIVLRRVGEGPLWRLG